jgi:hypothetical protein
VTSFEALRKARQSATKTLSRREGLFRGKLNGLISKAQFIFGMLQAKPLAKKLDIPCQALLSCRRFAPRTEFLFIFTWPTHTECKFLFKKRPVGKSLPKTRNPTRISGRIPVL